MLKNQGLLDSNESCVNSYPLLSFPLAVLLVDVTQATEVSKDHTDGHVRVL